MIRRFFEKTCFLGWKGGRDLEQGKDLEMRIKTLRGTPQKPIQCEHPPAGIPDFMPRSDPDLKNRGFWGGKAENPTQCKDLETTIKTRYKPPKNPIPCKNASAGIQTFGCRAAARGISFDCTLARIGRI